MKRHSISRALSNTLVAQYLGSLISFVSNEDVWLFSGLAKFLEYYIHRSSEYDSVLFRQLFINDVLHPTLWRNSITEEFPFSVDDALSAAVEAKGKQNCNFLCCRVSMSRCFSLILVPAACIFRMIYYVMGEEAFAVGLQHLVLDL